jgi:hypothetical protein
MTSPKPGPRCRTGGAALASVWSLMNLPAQAERSHEAPTR